ncbi:hypothetical protein [Frankia sp. Cr1]|uniref:hypothetical protein n=1 Tax=Frankia sp. Cr1 TaxID=3073931 RepID=UPI002AD486FA|nr:hypothetical protein [Frankia sp. Cr1]
MAFLLVPVDTQLLWGGGMTGAALGHLVRSAGLIATERAEPHDGWVRAEVIGPNLAEERALARAGAWIPEPRPDGRGWRIPHWDIAWAATLATRAQLINAQEGAP